MAYITKMKQYSYEEYIQHYDNYKSIHNQQAGWKFLLYKQYKLFQTSNLVQVAFL